MKYRRMYKRRVNFEQYFSAFILRERLPCDLFILQCGKCFDIYHFEERSAAALIGFLEHYQVTYTVLGNGAPAYNFYRGAYYCFTLRCLGLLKYISWHFGTSNFSARFKTEFYAWYKCFTMDNFEHKAKHKVCASDTSEWS